MVHWAKITIMLYGLLYEFGSFICVFNAPYVENEVAYIEFIDKIKKILAPWAFNESRTF